MTGNADRLMLDLANASLDTIMLAYIGFRVVHDLQYPYIYRWKNNEKRAALKGRRCRLLARGSLNSALVEFENGQREIISRNALRKDR